MSSKSTSRLPALLLALALLCPAAPADNRDKELFAAAAQGDTAAVLKLIAEGVAVEAKDKNGRTPLMLAAQQGHPAAVRLLLEKGASQSARDTQGATAWVLARFSPSGKRREIADVLKLLPVPPPPRLVIEAAWSRENLYSSCGMSPEQLAQHVAGMQPDAMLVAALRDQAASPAGAPAQIVRTPSRGNASVPGDDAFRDSDAVLVLEVRPSAACVPQNSVDSLSLAIDLRLIRASDRTVILKKTFGGGLKGMHTKTAANAAQYLPLYREWLMGHAAAIYQAALEAWYRTK